MRAFGKLGFENRFFWLAMCGKELVAAGGETREASIAGTGGTIAKFGVFHQVNLFEEDIRGVSGAADENRYEDVECERS